MGLGLWIWANRILIRIIRVRGEFMTSVIAYWVLQGLHETLVTIILLFIMIS